MGASGVGAEKEKKIRAGRAYIHHTVRDCRVVTFLMESKVGIVYRQVMDRYVHF